MANDLKAPTKGIRIVWVAVIYFGLLLVALGAHATHPVFLFPARDERFWHSVGVDVLAGLLLGLGVAGLSALAVRLIPGMRRLAGDFHQLIGALSLQDAFFLSAFSAIAEETFFRGFVQAKLGWGVTSLIFGLFHVGPGRRFLVWTVTATALGFALGGLYEWRHDLFLPIAMHFAINFVNLSCLGRWAKTQQANS